jgi:hypothetical protein
MVIYLFMYCIASLPVEGHFIFDSWMHVVVRRGVVSKHLALPLFLIDMLWKHALARLLLGNITFQEMNAHEVVISVRHFVINSSLGNSCNLEIFPNLRVDDGIITVERPDSSKVYCFQHLILASKIISYQHKALPQGLINRDNHHHGGYLIFKFT